MPQGTGYPSSKLYTLQWPGTEDEFDMSMIPHNSEAAFKRQTHMPKPSDLLLHYHSGAAAIKIWGFGTEVLRDHVNPPPPKPVKMGPSKTTHDRKTAIQKRDDAFHAQRGSGRNATAGPSRITRSAQKRDTDEVAGGNAVAGSEIYSCI
jgi:hypothetical protein